MRYQDNLKTSMGGSDFIFDSVKLMHYKMSCKYQMSFIVKVNYKLGGSYINSPDWIENKKAKINPNSKIINVLSIQQLLHYVITILSIIQKESQILIHL